MSNNSTLSEITIARNEAAECGCDKALACNLTAISAAERPQHMAAVAKLFGPGLEERQELADGYAYRFSAEDYAAITDFVAKERLCCPFFNFAIELAPNAGPIWLRMSGGEGGKEFIAANFNQF